jgi:hypothetical protein
VSVFGLQFVDALFDPDRSVDIAASSHRCRVVIQLEKAMLDPAQHLLVMRNLLNGQAL